MKSPQLKLELFVKGSKSQTDLCLCYMADRVPKKLIQRIKARLDTMELESILSSGYVQPFLENRRGCFFNTVGTTQRPDVLCAKLLEGRVGLLIDGTPFALVIPKLFCESFQTMDDYCYHPVYTTFIRWIKYAAFLVAVLLPSLYLAVALHHPELLNRTLLLILADAEQMLYFIITYWGHTFGIRVEADIRAALFGHMQELGFEFFDRNRTGQLMSRMTTDLFEITELAHHGPEDLFISLVTIVGALAIENGH